MKKWTISLLALGIIGAGFLAFTYYYRTEGSIQGDIHHKFTYRYDWSHKLIWRSPSHLWLEIETPDQENFLALKPFIKIKPSIKINPLILGKKTIKIHIDDRDGDGKAESIHVERGSQLVGENIHFSRSLPAEPICIIRNQSEVEMILIETTQPSSPNCEPIRNARIEAFFTQADQILTLLQKKRNPSTHALPEEAQTQIEHLLEGETLDFLLHL